MNRNNVFLVGFMGSGKTAVYKEISPLVKSENFDLDEEIIKKYGSIETIFEKEGEAHFRALEQKNFSSIPKWRIRNNLAEVFAFLATG